MKHAPLDRHGVARRHADGEAERHRGGGLRRRRNFRKRPAVFRRLAVRGEAICADLGLRILLFQPFRDFEAAPRARMAKNFDRAEAEVRRDGAARRRPDAGVQQHRAGRDRRRQRRGGRPARARRARRAARLPHRLRGAGLGPPCEQVRPCLEDRAGGRSSGRRPGRRQLPHLRDRGRRCADRQDSRRPHFLRAACRRADDAARSAVVEPAFPPVSRPGRISGDAVHPQCAGQRLQRADLARNFQRRIPRRAAAPDRDRRDALAAAA